MNTIRTLAQVAVLAAALMVGACDFTPRAWKKPNMTELSPRLQAIFERTRTVCFGRFLIDVPAATTAAWGPAQVPLTTEVYEGEAASLATRIAEREAELKSKARYPRRKGLTLYLETLEGALPDQRMIVSQETFSSTGMLRIESFFAMGPHLVRHQARPLADDQSGTIMELNDLAQRLSPRTEDEIPAEPGLCIEHAFLADTAEMVSSPYQSEHLRIGFRLDDFPDTHLSIYTAAKSDVVESDAVEPRLKEAEKQAWREGKAHLYAQIKFLRKGERALATVTGYEVLARMPEPTTTGGRHEFRFGSLSSAGDTSRPMFDIRLDTGQADNETGQIAPALTDAETIALWDKITSSIRLRPILPAKPTPEPNAALGTPLMTGRTCPQSGLWQAEDGERRYFSEGDTLPAIRVAGKPSFIERLRGAQPLERHATLWTLVAYGPDPAAGQDPTAGFKPAPDDPSSPSERS